MRVLLLAPPGIHQYVRDNYCSKVAKADYSYEPVDLLLLSGRFSDIHFIDAIKENLSPETCLGKIETLAPDVVISLVGAVSWPEDRSFLAAVKARLPHIKILTSGDSVLEAGVDFMDRNPWLNAAILDYTNDDVVNYLNGDYQSIVQMVYRTVDGEIVEAKAKRQPREIIQELPQPNHRLFEGRGYAYPFVRHSSFATVQTDYGCPFPCRFCVFGCLGYRIRPTDEIMAELRELKESGVREIYFNDQTFGGTSKRLEELCQAMIEADLNLGWCCWNRVDVVEPHLELMKRAGCHTIMFGVETASDETLKANRKGFTIAKVRSTFARCHELGIRTLATYLIGMPGENVAMIEKTIDLAVELDSDFASFNVLVPRQGTEVRQDMIEAGDLLDDDTALDQSGASVNVTPGELTPKQIKSLRDRAVRRFYMRPSYILKRVVGIRTVYDAKTLIRTALSMVWS